MSENVKESENKNTPEIEKIDILNLIAAFWNGFRKLWILMLVIVIICTLRSYFRQAFLIRLSMSRLRQCRLRLRGDRIIISSQHRRWRRFPVYTDQRGIRGCCEKRYGTGLSARHDQRGGRRRNEYADDISVFG